MNKKIFFISTNLSVEWGGSEELWFQCAKEFLNNGIKVGVLVEKESVVLNKFVLARKMNMPDFFYTKNKVSFLFKRLMKIIGSIDCLDSLKQIVKWSPDLVVISQGNNSDGLAYMEYFSKMGIKYVTISQAVYEGMWPNPITAERLQIGFRKAVSNYFVSQSNLKVTSFQLGMDVPNSKIVRNPFNVPFENNLGYPDSSILNLACVARFEFYAKGQDVLLEVLSQKKWIERNLLVNFYGSGKDEEGLKKLINYFELKNVEIKGFVPTVQIWESNHALILPSRFEGLPLALVEAMLCARFGIVTNVSGNKEVILDNVNGFLAEAPQPEYLDAAMERVWNKKSEWELIGLEAKKHIQKLVSPDPAHDFYLELNKLF